MFKKFRAQFHGYDTEFKELSLPADELDVYELKLSLLPHSILQLCFDDRGYVRVIAQTIDWNDSRGGNKEITSSYRVKVSELLEALQPVGESISEIVLYSPGDSYGLRHAVYTKQDINGIHVWYASQTKDIVASAYYHLYSYKEFHEIIKVLLEHKSDEDFT